MCENNKVFKETLDERQGPQSSTWSPEKMAAHLSDAGSLHTFVAFCLRMTAYNKQIIRRFA